MYPEPIRPDEYPSIRDVIDSWRPDSAVDLGWQSDRIWTARRVFFTAVILLFLFLFLVYSLQGLFAPPAAVPTLPSPPMSII